MTIKPITEEIVRDMVQSGVIFGHKKLKTHPKMKRFVSGTKNELELLNPASSWESLGTALAFLEEVAAKGGTILFTGTTAPAKKKVESFAKEFSYPYVVTRWLGGTLTNFSAIRGRALHYENLKEKKEKGAFEKYTKKEQHDFSEEIGRLSRFFEGLSLLKKVPEAIFVVDAKAHETAIREAKKLGIPVVAVIDTNDDPSKIDYPILASDHGVKSVEWVMQKVGEALNRGKAPAREKAAAIPAALEKEDKKASIL